MKKMVYFFIFLLCIGVAFADLSPYPSTRIPFGILFIAYFFINMAIETTLLVFLAKKKFSIKRIILAGIVMNTVTHPLAFFTIGFMSVNFWIGFLVVEAMVWIAESLLIYLFFRKKMGFKKAMRYALIVNAVTAALSFLPLLSHLF